MQLSLVDRQANTIAALGAAELPGPEMLDSSFQPLLVAADGANAALLSIVGKQTTITSFPTSDPGARVTRVHERGNDTGFLPRLFPGPDEGHFLLFDDTGVYAYDYQLQEERLILAMDQEGLTTPLALNPVAYSPTGRWLLVESLFFEGYAQAVLDTQSGVLLDLPDSSSYVISAGVSWLSDGKIVVFSAATEEAAAGPTAAVYELLDGDGGAELAAVSAAVVPTIPEVAQPGYRLLPPNYQTADDLRMVVVGGDPALWRAAGAVTQRLATIPANLLSVLWLDDASGLLLFTGDTFGMPTEIRYLAADGSSAVLLNEWFGSNAADFHWITPLP
jgi:hypothetical protein